MAVIAVLVANEWGCKIVRGPTAAIRGAGEIGLAEAGVLRTIRAALHCPLPPQLDRAA